MVKNLPAEAGDIRDMGSTPGSGRFPWRRKWLTTPVFLPGQAPWTEDLVGYSHDWSNLSHTCGKNYVHLVIYSCNKEDFSFPLVIFIKHSLQWHDEKVFSQIEIIVAMYIHIFIDVYC